MSEPLEGRVYGSSYGLGAGKDIRRMRNVTPGHEAEPMPTVACPEGAAQGLAVFDCMFAGDPHRHGRRSIMRPPR